MGELKIKRISAPYLGMNSETNQTALADGEALFLQNFLVHRDNFVPMRGGLYNDDTYGLAAYSTSAAVLAGVWTFNNRCLVTRAAVDATKVREPHTTAYAEASTASLADPNTTYHHILTGAAGSVTPISGTVDDAPGGRCAVVEGKAYGFAYGGSTNLTYTTGGNARKRAFLQWGGGASAPTVYTAAPDSGQDVIEHLHRIFVLGARDVPGAKTTINPNSLIWSNPGGPVTDTVGVWQDAGITNQIIIGGDDGDVGVALAHVGENLLILKRRSLYILYGYSSATFQVKRFSSNVGCLDPRSVVELGDGVFFASDAGLMYTDGSSLVNISSQVRSYVSSYTRRLVGDAVNPGARVAAMTLPNDYLLFSMLDQDFASPSATGASIAWLYHVPTGRWSTFYAHPMTHRVPAWGGRVSPYNVMFGTTRFYISDFVTAPERDLSGVAQGIDSGPSVNSRSIYAWWVSPSVELGDAAHGAKMHRVLIDTGLLRQDNDDDDPEGGFSMFLTRGDSSLMLGPTDLASLGFLTNATRKRDVRDVFTETMTSDARIDLHWFDTSDPATEPIAKADVYGAFLEYEVIRQRRSG